MRCAPLSKEEAHTYDISCAFFFFPLSFFYTAVRVFLSIHSHTPPAPPPAATTPAGPIATAGKRAEAGCGLSTKSV